MPSFGKPREQGTKLRSPSATRLSEDKPVPRGVPGAFSRGQAEEEAHSIKQSCVPLFPHIHIYKGLLQPACLLGVPLFPPFPDQVQHENMHSSCYTPDCARPGRALRKGSRIGGKKKPQHGIMPGLQLREGVARCWTGTWCLDLLLAECEILESSCRNFC
uniref:Uncharacterized protein n=1 Tax=Pseudomonas aeruginosa TaxID=287 RepID=A0A0H4P8F3_PSEAI|nr:Hypothetical protein [Pseudomonas aeruginosa]